MATTIGFMASGRVQVGRLIAGQDWTGSTDIRGRGLVITDCLLWAEANETL